MLVEDHFCNVTVPLQLVDGVWKHICPPIAGPAILSFTFFMDEDLPEVSSIPSHLPRTATQSRLESGMSIRGFLPLTRRAISTPRHFAVVSARLKHTGPSKKPSYAKRDSGTEENLSPHLHSHRFVISTALLQVLTLIR